MRSRWPLRSPIPRPIDTAIRGEIEEAIQRDGRIGAPDQVQARVEHGIVQLTGTVTSAEEKHVAEELAAAQPGVIAVQDRITVTMDGGRRERHNNRTLEAAVNRRLARLGGRLPEIPSARVDHGIATIMGRVDTEGQVVEAVRAAGRVHGLKAVVSAMSIGDVADVGPETPLVGDSALTGMVGAALAGAGVHLMELRVEAHGGEVHLYGRTGTEADRVRAAAAARQVHGVHHVVNRIKVRRSSAVSDREEALARRVYGMLARDPRINESQVKVEAVGAEVYLTGQTEGFDGWTAALEVARAVPGVSRVKNLITITDPTSLPSDDKGPRFAADRRLTRREARGRGRTRR